MCKRFYIYVMLVVFVVALGCQRKKTKQKNPSRSNYAKSVTPKDSVLKQQKGKSKSSPFGKGWSVVHYEMKVNQTGWVTLYFKQKNNKLLEVVEKVNRGESVPILFASRAVQSTKKPSFSVRLALQVKKNKTEGKLSFKGISHKKPSKLGGDGFATGMSPYYDLAIPSHVVLRNWLWGNGLTGLGTSGKRHSLSRGDLHEVKSSFIVTQNGKPVDANDKRIAWWSLHLKFSKRR